MSNRDAAIRIIRSLRDAGHTAYLAGGCVRDQLLGLSPKDHDVATSATPTQIRGIFRNTQAVGAAFGVILVRDGSEQIEVATFRTDGTYSDGRRPDSVKFSTPEEDAQRRDFTINGLFYDPLEGKIIDFVGGQADLQARVLRAIGDPEHRFTEDHLRLLRAVRFAARFEMTIDPPTAGAIRRHAVQLRKISPERVGEELRRTLTPTSRARAFELLRQLQILPELFRFLTAPDVHHLDLFPHLAPGRSVSFALALAAAYLDDSADLTPAGPGTRDTQLLSLLSPLSAAKTARALRQALRLSNEELDDFEAILVTSHGLLLPEPPTLARKRRFLASPTSAEALELLRALARADLFADRLSPLLSELKQLAGRENAPPPLLTGDHLAAAGLKPGPMFKRLLDQTYDAQLENRISTSEQALAFALALVPSE